MSIQELENLSSLEEILFENIDGTSLPTSGKNINLSKSLSNYNCIYIVIGCGNNTLNNPNTTLVLTSTFSLGKELDIYQGGDGSSSAQRRVYLSKNSDNILTFRSYDVTAKLYQIIGIKY